MLGDGATSRARRLGRNGPQELAELARDARSSRSSAGSEARSGAGAEAAPSPPASSPRSRTRNSASRRKTRRRTRRKTRRRRPRGGPARRSRATGAAARPRGGASNTAHAPSALPLTTCPSATRASAVDPARVRGETLRRRGERALDRARERVPDAHLSDVRRDAVSAYSPSKTTEVTSPARRGTLRGEHQRERRRRGHRAREGDAETARGAGWAAERELPRASPRGRRRRKRHENRVER